MRRVCTIAARNYLPSVGLLAESLRRIHPDVPMSVLLVDADESDELRDLPFDVVRPGDLPLGPDGFARMATYYDVTELSTALKPTLLRLLLDEADVVMYLDPDIEVFAPLDELFEAAAEHEIVLTPHVTQPIPRDGLDVREEAILAAGQFNLGFVAVSARATAFLDYWEERTLRHALVDVERGYFTDQRWVDAVPSLFPHSVVRDPRFNVAYWNLHERTLTVDADEWSVDGAPLGFFHFSGHDDAEPYQLSRHLLRPRVRVDREPALRRLLRERSERMVAARDGAAVPPYRWARTARGLRIDEVARRTYWSAVVEAELDGSALPPSAFDESGGRRFAEWLREPVVPTSPVSRYVFGLWTRSEDLRRAFPDPLGSSGPWLMRWTADHMVLASAMPPQLKGAWGLDDATVGVNLVGYLEGEFGVASASRGMARLLRGAGLPVASTTLRTDFHRHGADSATTLEGAPFDLSVLMVNPDDLLARWPGPQLAAHRGRRRVGVWYWEVGVLPEPMRHAAGLVDEVWCASDYVRDCIAPWVDVPVRTHPIALAPTVPSTLTRGDLGLPEDPFLFGFVFDYASVPTRKNPLGLIDAYRQAFGPDDGAALVLKTLHADRMPGEAALIRDAVGDRHDVVIVDDHYDAIEMNAFYQRIDAYVSLHRAEGFGLTIAAAMAAGTPAVVTGWSGNLEFTTAENALLVPYSLTAVGPGAVPYPADAVWAEPDLDAAAAAMRRLFDDRSFGEALGARAARELSTRGAHGVGAEWILAQYDRLTGSRIAA